MQKKTGLLLIFPIVLTLLSAYFAFSTFLAPTAPFVTQVSLRFYDYSSREAIGGLPVNFAMTTRTGNVFTIFGASDENGMIVQTLLTNDIAFPVSAENISISGRWVLEESVGEGAWYAADEMWTANNLSAFKSDSSEYVFDEEVHLSHDRDGSKLSLGLDFYLLAGKVAAIHDPLREVMYYGRHLRIIVLNRNFVPFNGAGYAVVPAQTPLQVDLEAIYYIHWTQPFKWEVRILVDVGNRTFINLLPSFARAFSSAQVDVLMRSLDNLAPYGFGLTEQYDEISRISGLYDAATGELEDDDYEAFNSNWQRAMYLFRDLFIQITGIYISGVGWIPSLVMIFLFFSLALSRLITNRKDTSIVLFIIIFLAVFSLFFFTQPFLRLFVFNPLVLVQSFTFSLLIQLFAQLLPALVIVILMLFAQIRSLVWETFGVGLRNLRRRRLKTVLALFTVLIVSASAMSFLTITAEKPTLQALYRDVEPRVDTGLVIYKTMTQVVPEARATWVSYLPIQKHEIEWLSEHEWIEAMSVYGVRKVGFAGTDGFTIGNFSTFNLVIVNVSFMAQYQNVSDVLGIEWFEDIDRNMVIVGSRIAEAYDLEMGSVVLINDKNYAVKSIIDEEAAIDRLRDIDGDLFLFKVSDPLTKKMEGESILFGTLEDFEVGSFSIYRVSVILKSGYVQNATQIASEIQGFGYDFGKTEDYSYVVSYLVRAIVSDSVYIIYSQYPTATISGQWQTQIVPIIITALVLVANTMGTVEERKSEVRTVYTIGATPLRVGLIFVTEGLVLGIVGGVFGYVFGYLLVRYANIALPTLVKENIVGGAPFTVAISTATLASLLGCLLPSRKAIRVAVPSGRVERRVKDIMEIQDGKANLKIPLKVERDARILFARFLVDLTDKYSYPNFRFMSMSPPYIEDTREVVLYEISVSHVKDEPASFLVSILARPRENLEVTIQPLEDFETRKICRWNRRHKKNINELSTLLREEIMRFTDHKRKKGLYP